MIEDDDKPVSPEEEAAARALAEALDGRSSGDAPVEPGDLAAATRIRAVSGREAPLGELRARGIARAAIAAASAKKATAPPEAKPAPRPRQWLWALASLAAAACLALGVWASGGAGSAATAKLPERLRSRSAGLLVPGPFPASQTAADRLDVVTTDRMVAFREVRARRLGARR